MLESHCGGCRNRGELPVRASVEPSTAKVPFSLALAHDPRHRDGLDGLSGDWHTSGNIHMP